MNPSREEDLFALALELPTEKRAAFVDAECKGDPALRQRLEALLAAHEEPESVAGPNQRRPFDDEPAPAEQVGSQVGRYKLLEKLGVGGFGEVWEAEQTEPVRRRVALKVIKLGMDTQQVVARFEAERQALAMMDHPNIAKVLDAGTTDLGRPYFVMELVRGIRITEYCDQAHLSTEDRLDLFIKVCQAIQHAHQKGIIHRDIKPSNILVTLHDGPAAAGVPKVIDFGIAKATEGRLADATIHTQLHQFIGTPAYMSPEQAAMGGLDIDTRSDIYSLGVLLYELLAGSTPFDAKELMSQDIDSMRKTIREKEPLRPSTRLATLGADQLTTTAERRSADSSKLLHQLKGDLDWIVMKCLEKDRQRRYDTANGLAADLKRHLDNEPVLARPPSAAYKFQKAFRRNKLVFSAAAAVAVALILGVIVSAWQVVRARRAEADSKAALHFIQDGVLSQASPGSQPNRDLTVRALLESIAGRLDRATGRTPLVEASIRQTLGSVYTELSDYPGAARQYNIALQLQRTHLSESHPDTLRSLHGLVMACWWNGDLAQAEPLTREGLKISTEALGEKDPITLQFMQARAFVVMTLGEMPWTKLEPFYLKALKLHREVLGTNDLRTLTLIQGLSHGYVFNWQEAKAESLIVEALARSQLATNHPQTGMLTIALGWSYAQLNQLEKAEDLARRSWVLRKSILGDTNSRTLSSALILATVHVHQKQFDKAEPRTAEAFRLRPSLAGINDLYLPHQLSELGWAYLEQGQVARAAELCDWGLQAMPRKPDVSHVMLPRIITQLGAVRLAQEKYSEAEELLRESLLLAEKRWPDAAYRYHVMSLLGASLSGQRNHADAEPLLLQGCQGLQQRQASLPRILNAPRRITEAHERLVQLYDAWGKPGQAAEWKQKLAAFQQANPAGGKTPERP